MIKYIISGCVVLSALHIGWKRFQEKVAIAEKELKQSMPEEYDAEKELKKLSKRNQLKYECLNARKSIYEIDTLRDLKDIYDDLDSGKYPSRCIEEFECMKDGYALCSGKDIFDTDYMCKYCWQLNFDELYINKEDTSFNEKIAYIMDLQRQDMYVSDFLGKEISYHKIVHDPHRFGTAADNNIEEDIDSIITHITFVPNEDEFSVTITTKHGESFKIYIDNGNCYVKETDNISNIMVNIHGPRYTYVNNIIKKSDECDSISIDKDVRNFYTQKREGDKIIWSI